MAWPLGKNDDVLFLGLTVVPPNEKSTCEMYVSALGPEAVLAVIPPASLVVVVLIIRGSISKPIHQSLER